MVGDTQEAAVPDQHHQPIENVNSRAQLTTTDLYLAFTTCLLWLVQREKFALVILAMCFFVASSAPSSLFAFYQEAFSCSSSDSEKEDQAIVETGTNSNETEQQVEPTPEPEPEPSTEETSEPDDKESEEQEEFDYTTGDSSYIFDQNQLHTFELTLSEEDLALIDKEPGKEEYVEGSMIFEGQKIGPVGIRYKGSVGAWVGCVSGDFFQAEGEKTCTKLSMKVKINWEDTDDTFYGLKKLQFHSQNLDPTKMHERLGYWLFEKWEFQHPDPFTPDYSLTVNTTESLLSQNR